MSAAIETSVDGGVTWTPGPRCSERIQVDALLKGYREYVSHRSRKHEYPHGIMVRWYGEVAS